jgi:2',3'-cyclic-nucleotide 2'-phosphodiesterase/3'-nucleotidase
VTVRPGGGLPLEIRQLLIGRASSTGVIDPADFADDNWQLVRDGEPLLP